MGASVARRLAPAQGAQSKKMKRKWMKLLTRISIACLVSLLGVGYTTSDSGAKVTDRNRNQIKHLSLQRQGDQDFLWVKGTQKIRYATFVLDEPLRLVVDFQNANLQGLQGPYSYDQSRLVRTINVRQYSNRNKSIGRLVMLLQPDTRWLIRPKGNRLLVVFRRGMAPQEKTSPAIPETPARIQRTSAPQPSKAKLWDQGRLPSRFHSKTPPRSSSVVRRSGIRHNPTQGRVAQRLLAVRVRKNSIFLRTNGSVASYEVLSLRNPSRLVVDLYQVRRYRRSLRQRLRRLRCATGPFRSVRFGRHADKLRLVFDLCQNSRFFRNYDAQLKRQGLSLRLQPLRKASNRKEIKSKAPTLARAQQARKTRVLRPRLYRTTAVVENVGVSATPQVASLVVQLEGRKPQIRRRDMGQLTFIDIHPAQLGSIVSQSIEPSDFFGAIEQIDVYPRGTGVRIALRKKDKVSIDWRRKASTLRIEVANPKAGALAKASKSKYTIAYDAKRVGQAGGAIAPGGGLSAGDLAILSRNNKRKRYRGRRISIFFRKVEIHNLLRLFAEISGLNIITSDNVKGSVTLRLRNVPWDQALELVLKTLKLGMEREGNIVRIATLNELQQEEQARRRLQQVKLLSQAQKIRLIPVNYATATAMATQVRTVLSPRGKVTVDNRTNVLIVRDYVPFLIRAEGLVRSLDTQTPQVLIETRIVEANINFDQQFGIQWGGHLLFSPLTGNGTGLQFPNPVGIRGSVPNLQGGQGGGDFGTPNYIINFPATVASGRGTALSFLFGSLTGAASLNLRLSAAEQSGHVKVISAPKIITLHKMQASIQQGLQIPFTSASAAGTNVQFITASLSLNVSPQVTTDGSIFLTMNITNNQPDFSRGGAAGPAISTKTAQTKMLIKDGETMVIGGVYSRRTGTSQSRIPFLSQIPVLGLLFKNYTYNDDRAELLIFVTPRIINRAQTLGGRQGS